MKKFLKIIFIVFVIFFLCFITFLPDVVKFVITRTSEKFINRKITIDDIDINLFKGEIEIKNFVLFEENKKDEFISFKSFYINIFTRKLFRKEFFISQLTLTEPNISLIKQQDDKFNFSDITEHLNKQEKK